MSSFVVYWEEERVYQNSFKDGWASEHPDLPVDDLVHCREVGVDDL